MTHTITFTQEEEAALEAAARAMGRPTADFLHNLILQSLLSQGHTPSSQRDQVAVRHRMVEQWKAIDAEEDRAAVSVGADVLEEAAA